MKSYRFLVLFLFVSFFSCGKKNIAQDNPAYLLLSIQKTPCLGTCPEYIIELFADGKVKFHGISNVLFVGKKSFKLDRDDFQEIKKTMDSLSFFELKDKYYDDVSDLPTTYIYYNNGDQRKKIMDYYGAPKKLKDAENRIEEIVFSYLKADTLKKVN